MRRRSLIQIAALLVFCTAGLLVPTTASAGMYRREQIAREHDWNSLSPGEKRILANRRNLWKSYSPARRARLLRGVRRFQRLSPAEQAEARHARRRFQKMSPQERRRLREEYRRYRRVPRFRQKFRR